LAKKDKPEEEKDTFNIYLSGCEKEGSSLTRAYYFYMMMKLGQKKLLFMLLLMQTPCKKGASNYAKVGEEFLVKALLFEHSLESPESEQDVKLFLL
jgi:hypothetical protein